MDAAVKAMRLYALENPAKALQVRYNRARVGDLKEGDKVPDVTLYRVEDGKPETVREAGTAKRPMVVVAGSYT